MVRGIMELDCIFGQLDYICDMVQFFGNGEMMSNVVHVATYGWGRVSENMLHI